MKKYSFTPEGIQDLQKELYKFSDEALIAETLTIADDFLSWLALRIELEVHILEQMRNLPQALRLRVGWCLASCVLARSPFTIEVTSGEADRTAFSFSGAFCPTGVTFGQDAITFVIYSAERL
jgi:hypothetical protein